MMSILCMIPLAETLFHNKSHKCAVPGVMNFVPHYVLLAHIYELLGNLQQAVDK